MGRVAHTPAHVRLAPDRSGLHVVQLSRALGHHSAAFTLSVYVHLLEGEKAPALDLADALARRGSVYAQDRRSELVADR